MRLILFIFFFLNFSYYSNGQNFKSIQPLSNNNQPKLHRDLIKNWKELIQFRSKYSAAYVKDDGTIIHYFSKETVNYWDEIAQSYFPISTIPILKESRYISLHQEHPFTVNTDGSVILGGNTLSFNAKLNTNTGNFRFNSQSSITLVQDTLLFANYFPGVDKQLCFRNNGLKQSYILNNNLYINGDIIFFEEILIDKNTHLSILEKDENHLIKGSIVAKKNDKELAFSITPVWVYDANGVSVICFYELIEISAQHYQIKYTVPYSYLNSGLSFPITIDPLIIGPTSNWSGGVMPSCFSPNFNVDSLQITVPGQISVSSLNVTSNYYANPFTPAIMSQGQMFFSTSCGSSTNFTVAPPTGNSAGTAYLSNFNLSSPLMCCRAQTCNSYTFYLRMHLSRTANGTGCNSTYIYYDPTSVWPFSAYVEGNSVESYSNQATVLTPEICANECQLQIRTYTRFGVPPFTLTHPWLAIPNVAGIPAGCSSSFTIQTVTLDIPNCPNNCDTNTILSIPAPTVTDACGNIVSNYPPLSTILKPVANVNAVSGNNSIIVCSGETALLGLESCIAGGNISWYGIQSGNTNQIVDSNTTNISSNIDTLFYFAYADLNGCIGDTSSYFILTEPIPDVDFVYQPQPIFIENMTVFDDLINSASTITNWNWYVDGTFISSDSLANYIFLNPGEYEVCLSASSINGCADTICKMITVLPLEIVLPNVISPNGDLLNDELEFTYLTFFESNHLIIYNRWGQPIYDKENYQNDWSGGDLSEGVYYYILTVEEKNYAGFFHLFR